MIADAIFYLVCSGRARRMLSREFPPRPTIYSRFRRRRLAGTLPAAHEQLRWS